MTRAFSLILLTGFCTLPGCSDSGSASRQPVFPVTGTVTMSGTPLADAAIGFSPQQGQPTATGRTDSAGKFQLTTYDHGDGAAAGSFNVVVSKSAAEATDSSSESSGDGDHEMDSEDDGHSAEAAAESIKSELVPQEYTSSTDTPFKAEVKTDGENNFTFEIK